MAQQVTLIGDSIRMGYQPEVTRLLGSEFDVWGPKLNAWDSMNILAHLEEWCLERPADVIHINCGLHDIKKDPATKAPVVGPDQYRENVRKILEMLKTKEARLIWATTTPVSEARHNQAGKGFYRFEADVEVYNSIAAEVATELGVEIDDLHQVIVDSGRDPLLTKDGVHFTPEGYALLGQQVAKVIAG